jgi:hypothetical protein
MSAIINGDSPSVTFSDGSTQATSAIVSGKVPYTNLPAGSVLQVVNVSYGTPASTTSATYADTGLTATITPKFSTSKILVMVVQNGSDKAADSSTNGITIQLLRNSTIIPNSPSAWFANYVGYTATTLRLINGSACINYLDSPATTSATTYKTQYANTSAGGNVSVQSNNNISTMTLMEIAA